TEVNDGFEIAEKDLDIRGPGEFFGKKQCGLPELKFGDIVRDFSIMEEARREAFSFVNEDPELQDPRNAEIRHVVFQRFKDKLK
ncbi:MAG: DNA helicase RecG, partial [Candidatus Omnitrophota bacterium]